jgi:hypothetical protein
MSSQRDAAAGLHLQRRHCSRRAALACAIQVLLLAALPASRLSAGPADVPLEDLLQIVVTSRELLAIDAEGGGDTPERLELDERVLWSTSRGRVGVALTDRRMLAVGTGSAAWQSTRYLRGESRPHHAELGDRVALITTDRRILGFNGGSGNLVEQSIGPRERVLRTSVSANLALVVTDRRALALSPFSGGFFEAPLRLGESVLRLVTSSDVATLTTSHRLLVFRGRAGAWSERRLELR